MKLLEFETFLSLYANCVLSIPILYSPQKNWRTNFCIEIQSKELCSKFEFHFKKVNQMQEFELKESNSDYDLQFWFRNSS